MCQRCVSRHVDLTRHITRASSVDYCPDCCSYFRPPSTWHRLPPESLQLLHLLVSRCHGLDKLHVAAADFIWTEPHSKRINIKLQVKGKGNLDSFVQQAHLVEFKIHDRLCDSCTRTRIDPDQWVAKVQLRQDAAHRRTFFYLEQLILKHRAADKAVRIVETAHGIDFMFSKQCHAEKFVSFVAGVVPVHSEPPHKSLVTHDTKNNTYEFHPTFPVRIAPVCREDLICLPPEVSRRLGDLGPLVVCTKVTDNIALVDVNPSNPRTAYLNAKEYWRTPFRTMLSSRQLVEYCVLDVEHERGSRCDVAYVEVARVSDFGKNDTKFVVRTRLGHLFKPGDYALGYDLHGANLNDANIDKFKGLVIPDVILIKKSYEGKRQRRRGKPRAWKLKTLNMEVNDASVKGRIDEEKRNEEYEKFLDDLEENPEARFNISLYRNEDFHPSENPSSVGGGRDDDVPEVPLDELLADLDLSDAEDSDTVCSMTE